MVLILRYGANFGPMLADGASYIPWPIQLSSPNISDGARFDNHRRTERARPGNPYPDAGHLTGRVSRHGESRRQSKTICFHRFGHTPLSIEEEIPWKCQRLVIGTGTGALPVMEEVSREAHRRKIKLQILPTAKAIKTLEKHPERTNAILHLTC